MLDILTIVHDLADGITASRIRCTCKKLSKLIAKPTKHNYYNIVEYRVGTILHREDGPAKEWLENKLWYFRGNPHREDGPAKEWSDGTKEWYLHGKLHREDGPALELCNGSKLWYLHGYRYGTVLEYNEAMEKVILSRSTV